MSMYVLWMFAVYHLNKQMKKIVIYLEWEYDLTFYDVSDLYLW